MGQGRVLRIFVARPLQVAFDQVLRDVMVPDLRTRDGIVEVWVGRRGPDELGERAVVSLWRSMAGMVGAMGDDIERSRFHPDQLGQTADRRLEVLPVRTEIRGTGRDATILRIARGRLASIDLETYAHDVHAGALRDLERGRGPTSLVLGESGADGFVTVSTWPDWETLAAATGASIEHPVRTREQHQLLDFSAVHLELVPLIP